MGRQKGNWEYNHPKVIKYLKDNNVEYYSYSGGQHLKILGDVAYIELWPSRMTYHVIQSEEPADTKYRRLNHFVNIEELDAVLHGQNKGHIK